MNIAVLMLGESLKRQGGIVSVQKLILQENLPTVQFKHIATLPKGSSLAKVFGFIQAVNQLLWQIIRGKPDIVHIHVSERGSAYRQMVTAWLCQQFHIPVILHAHSCDFHEFYPTVPPLLQSWMSAVYRRCDRFIVLSESWKKFYVESLDIQPECVVVLPNPVKLPLSVPDRAGRDRINLIFLGRIGQRKGAFDLIQAFAELPSKQKCAASLTLAGDGEGDRARALAREMKMEDSIEILDWIDAFQRDRLLKQADALILPSYNEGLPMALIEAMSWGLAVITAPVGGIPELIVHEKNGLLVQPGHTQQLTNAMLSLIENERLRLTLGEAARDSVKSLDVHFYIEFLNNLYHEVVKSRK
jgi:glycosyltransferase involved in cell wall biosynthesis